MLLQRSSQNPTFPNAFFHSPLVASSQVPIPIPSSDHNLKVMKKCIFTVVCIWFKGRVHKMNGKEQTYSHLDKAFYAIY